MLAVVKTPHTEISIHGENAEAILNWIRKKFPVEVVAAHVAAADDEELIPVNETEWWQTMKHQLLAGARLKHGMSQEMLAEKSGIAQSVISQYESGKRKITMRAAIKLGRALGEAPEKLMAD